MDLTPEEEADHQAACRLLRRARAVVTEVTGKTPDAQVAEVFKFLAMGEMDREGDREPDDLAPSALRVLH